MEWLNLRTSTLHAPEYIGCDPRARATWVNVMLWCAQQENGGRIEQALGWKDRQWQQTCGVSLREVNAAKPLLSWNGDTLIVWNYPTDKEKTVRERRETGRIGGLKSGAVRSTKSEAPPEGGAKQTGEPNGEANASTEGKGIGKEEEGKGKEGAASAPPPPPPALPVVVVVPETLNFPEFLTPWAEWQAIRRKGKKPKSSWEDYFAKQLAWLVQFGPSGAAESVAHSARNEYQGLFPPRVQHAGARPATAPLPMELNQF